MLQGKSIQRAQHSMQYLTNLTLISKYFLELAVEAFLFRSVHLITLSLAVLSLPISPSYKLLASKKVATFIVYAALGRRN